MNRIVSAFCFALAFSTSAFADISVDLTPEPVPSYQPLPAPSHRCLPGQTWYDDIPGQPGVRGCYTREQIIGFSRGQTRRVGGGDYQDFSDATYCIMSGVGCPNVIDTVRGYSPY